MEHAPQNNPHQLAVLLQYAKNGDAIAFNVLVGKIRPYLHVLVRSSVGPDLKSNRDDSDLVQETLVRANEGFANFCGHDVPQFLAWVAKIVRNVIHTDARYQHAAKRNVNHTMHGTKLLVGLQAESMTPSARLARDEDAARLADAMQQLSEIQRNVIQWRFFDHLSFDEIGKHTGHNSGTIRVICLRAIKRLRTIMEQAT